jgi:CHAD domain-containing protein
MEAAPHDLEKMHRLRRGVRRLRYCLEWLGMSAKPLKAAQKVLGEANDLVMTMNYIDQSPIRHSMAEYRNTIETKLDAMAEQCAEVWHASRDSIKAIA